MLVEEAMEVLMEALVLPLLFDATVHAPGGEERERALRWQRGWPRPVVEAGRHVAGGVEQRDEGIEYAARLVQPAALREVDGGERVVVHVEAAVRRLCVVGARLDELAVLVSARPAADGAGAVGLHQSRPALGVRLARRVQEVVVDDP